VKRFLQRGLGGVGEGRGVATKGEVRKCGVRGGGKKGNLIMLKKSEEKL